MTRRSERGAPDGSATVLVVDDEADIRELLQLSLLRMGLGVECAGSLSEARALLKSRAFDLCLTDMRLPDGEGLELVRLISSQAGDLPVAVITAHGSMENAVEALKCGAFDYLTKPLSLDQLRTLVRSALALPANAAGRPGAQQLLGNSPAILAVRATVEKLARSQAPVYITGESGSGKELAARLIHDRSARRAQPFVPVNCGALPENLVESEFFGYRKGAFTGADSDREGFFHAARGGTLFLDEVADLPLPMQVKLLRAIQQRSVRRVGATAEEPVDVRMICATHRDLARLAQEGRFRQDLYYRLAVIRLEMPSLRECREDIGPLAEATLARLSADAPGRRFRLSSKASAALADYGFPGNARELENILERATALASGDEIQPEDLQLSPPMPDVADAGDGQRGSLQQYLDRVEREAILEALTQTRFNRTAAAKRLGITFRALRYRMERLGIR